MNELRRTVANLKTQRKKNTKRVFFAIVPPQSMHPLFSRLFELLQRSFPEQAMRWVPIKKLHVTLLFLGEIPQEQVRALKKSMSNLFKDIPAFYLRLGFLEWFPSQTHPKVLSLAVTGQDRLAELSALISAVVVPAKKSHEFRAHMTLAHFKKVPRLDFLKKIKQFSLPEILIDRVYLIESRSEQGACNYYSLADFKLGLA